MPTQKTLLDSFFKDLAEQLEDDHVPYFLIPDVTAAVRRLVERELHHLRTMTMKAARHSESMYVIGKQERRARW